MPLRVRLAALFHDLGKPHVGWRGRDGRLHFYARPGNRDHADVGAELADAALRRLRYPTELRERVVRIVRFHMFNVGKADTLHARRLLARYGEGLALDLLDHKEADLLGKGERRAARRARARAAARVPRGRRAGAREPAPALRPRASTAPT